MRASFIFLTLFFLSGCLQPSRASQDAIDARSAARWLTDYRAATVQSQAENLPVVDSLIVAAADDAVKKERIADDEARSAAAGGGFGGTFVQSAGNAVADWFVPGVLGAVGLGGFAGVGTVAVKRLIGQKIAAATSAAATSAITGAETGDEKA